MQSATDRLLALEPGTRFAIAFPLRLSEAVTHAQVVEGLRAQGFVRVVRDGVTQHLDELPADADLTHSKELLIVVDRLVIPDTNADRASSAAVSPTP